MKSIKSIMKNLGVTSKLLKATKTIKQRKKGESLKKKEKTAEGFFLFF